MLRHRMSLYAQPFEQIKRGKQTFEVRLNDPKRRLVQEGDEIIFSLLPGRKETLTVKVTGKQFFSNFRELYASAQAEQFGGESVEQLLAETYEIYTSEQEREFGALALKIELLT